MSAVNDFSAFPQVDELTADWLIPVALGTASAVGIGDLMYDGGSGVALPADVQADAGSLALNQALFASKFIGVSQQAVLLAETVTTKRITIRTFGIAEFDCASATFAVGDLLGPAAGAGPPALNPHKVVKVNHPDLAVAVVVPSKWVGFATTRIRGLFAARESGAFGNVFLKQLGDRQNTGLTAAADADVTLTVADFPIVTQTPTANPRKLILPAEARSAGRWFWVFNLAGATNGIQVRNSTDAATIITIPATKAGVVVCDGTTWRGIVGA